MEVPRKFDGDSDLAFIVDSAQTRSDFDITCDICLHVGYPRLTDGYLLAFCSFLIP